MPSSAKSATALPSPPPRGEPESVCNLIWTSEEKSVPVWCAGTGLEVVAAAGASSCAGELHRAAVSVPIERSTIIGYLAKRIWSCGSSERHRAVPNGLGQDHVMMSLSDIMTARRS